MALTNHTNHAGDAASDRKGDSRLAKTAVKSPSPESPPPGVPGSLLKGAIGIHVRRGDTVRYPERTFAPLDVYLDHARAIKRSTGEDRIFLASDDEGVLLDGMARLRNEFRVFTSQASVKSPRAPAQDTCAQEHIVHNPHQAFGMTVGVISDIAFLAECGFLIGTCMSQVSRLASELMQGRGALRASPIALDWNACASFQTHYYPIEVPWVASGGDQ